MPDTNDPAGVKARTPGEHVAVLVLTAAVLLRGIWSFGFFSRFADDSYIFMRYAANFGAGHGLVYNQGERVIAFTSPLFAAVTALLHAALASVDLEFLIRIVNLLFFVGLGWSILRACNPRSVAGVVGLLVLLFFFPLAYSSLNGMETTLYMGFIAASFWAARKQNVGAVVILATFALLTRPEGALLLVAAGMWCVRVKAKLPWRAIVASLVLIAVWVVSAKLYYGSVLPQSMLAKSGQVTGNAWAGIHVNPFETYAVLALGISSFQFVNLGFTQRLAVEVIAVLCLAPFLVSLVRSWRERSFLLIPALFFLLSVAFYVLGKPVRIWSWYAAPTAFVFIYIVTVEIARFLDSRPTRWMSYAYGAIAVLAVAGSFQIGLKPAGGTAQEDVLRPLALHLRDSYPTATSVMIGDIGNVGYLTGWRVIDLAGLVSPGVFRRDAGGNRVAFGTLVEIEHPDVIALESDPLQVKSFEQSLNFYQSFESNAQRAKFAATYVVDRSQRYGPIFIRKELLRSPGQEPIRP